MYDCFSCSCTYCCADEFLGLLTNIKKLLDENEVEEAKKYIDKEIKYYKKYPIAMK